MRTAVLVILSVFLMDILLTGFVLPNDLFGLVGTERLSRIYSPLYHHDLAPNREIEGARWGTSRYHFSTNSLGFKDRSTRTVPLTSDRPRILFMGDSFTEGNSFDFDRSFPGQVEALLADRQVEVLNAAVSSYSPAIYYRKIKYLLEDKHLEFDAVAVFIDISDIDDEARGVRLDENDNVVSRGAGPAEEYIEGLTLRVRSLLKRYSSIYRLASALNRQRKSNLTHVNSCLDAISPKSDHTGLDAGFFRAALDNPRSQWTWNETEYENWGKRGLDLAAINMTQLKGLLDAHGIPLIVAVYPWPEQIFERETNSRQSRFWRRWAAGNGADFLDLFPAFMKEADPLATYTEYFVPCDVHWNATGHRLVAERFVTLYRSLDGQRIPREGPTHTDKNLPKADAVPTL
ncbi:MAG: SGNH/GDSL hydrolase family protein [Rhodospirillales bacterium]|nr:SGNH/GDSL hydrolase family protein [Rhodospirillales bacterium]